MPNKLIFFGTEQFSRPALAALIEGGFAVAAVVTKPDSRRSRSGTATPSAVKLLAQEHYIEILQPSELDSLADALASYEPDMGVVVAYGKILPPQVLAVFKQGLLNIHPSDLPKYRGPSPIEQTILNGDKSTAVSLMQLEATMDSGPIYAKTEVSVAPNITKPQLYDQLAQVGAKLLVDKLPRVLNTQLQPQPQNSSQASYTRLIHKSDGAIDWQRPAEQIERQIRAYLGWPGSFTELFGVRITIIEASIDSKTGPAGEHYILDDGGLAIYANVGSIIIKRLVPAGRKAMTTAEFLRGYSP